VLRIRRYGPAATVEIAGFHSLTIRAVGAVAQNPMPILFAGLAAVVLAWALLPLIPLAPSFNGLASVDLDLYIAAARRWVGGGSFYEPYQLHGPYAIAAGDVLYPPVALWLFVPFTVMPKVLWWAIPVGVTVWALSSLRPSFVVWPLLALCVAWPPTLVKIATGNPVMWVVAAMSLGIVFVGPAVLVLLKPSLFPFAFWGANRRHWWFVLVAFALLCVPFGSMWGQWLAAVTNAQGGGFLYSIQEIPMLLLPVIAWLGRSQRATGLRRSLPRITQSGTAPWDIDRDISSTRGLRPR
jgi:hypothetical protein